MFWQSKQKVWVEVLFSMTDSATAQIEIYVQKNNSTTMPIFKSPLWI